MTLQTKDIPQAPSLARVRRVVDAVGRGSVSPRRIAGSLRMNPRAVLYHLAAARILGWLTTGSRGFALTPAGQALGRTERGSEEEREGFARAINASGAIRDLAAGLLADRPPSRREIARRAERAGLAPSTADQRARALLRWREQALGPPRLRYGVAEPAHVGAVRESVVQGNVPLTAGKSMLRRVRLQGFKSFVDEQIHLTRLTLLVGANASGKSNLLDAIRFLQGLALEMSITDILRGRYEGGRQTWPAIRGGINEVPRVGGEEFAVTSDWTIDGREVTHSIGCTTQPVPLVTREALRGHGLGQYLFDTHAKALGGSTGLGEGRAINVALRKGSGGRNPTQRHSASASLLGQVKAGGRVHELVPSWAGRVQRAMRSAVFLSISPDSMRGYAPRQAIELGATGENVSAVVNRLCEEEGGERRLVDWLSALCSPRVTGIRFVKTELGDVMLQLVEEDGVVVSARSLSDGTLRFLGEVVALLTAPPGSILLVEELENGLHPQRLHLLVELIEAATRERGIQVIATTHSPLVLRALSSESLREATVFGRIDGRPGSVARRLGELDHFDEVVERRGIERLFASGWLERAL